MNNKIIFGILIAAIFAFSAANAQFATIDIPLLQADGKPFGDKLYIEKGAVLEGDVVIGSTGVAESGWSSFIIELPAIGSTGCNFNLLSKDEPGLNPMTCAAGGTGCQCDIITWLKTPNTPVPAYQRSGVPMVDGSNNIIAGAQNTISFKTSVAVDTGVSDSNTDVVKASAPFSSSSIITKNGIPTGYVTVINTGTKSAGVDYDVVDPNGAPTAGRQGYGLFYGDHIYFYDDAPTGAQNLIRINIEHTVGSYTLHINNLLADTSDNLIIDNIGNAASPGIDYTRPGYTPNTVPTGFTKDILVYKPIGATVATFCPNTDVYSGTGVNDIAALWATAKTTCQGATTQSTIDTRINTDLGWTGEWFVYFNAAGSGGSTVGTYTQLDINDSAEGSSVATGAPVTFYAYYYNLSSGAPIDSTKSTCTLTDDTTGSNATYTMVYSAGRWSNTTATGYTLSGTRYWSVTCNTTAAGFFNTTANDDIVVTSGGTAAPEFSDIAYVLAAVLGAGGFVLIRKFKKGF